MSTTFTFDAAIAAHKAWLRHLEFVLAGIEPDKAIAAAVGDPTACSLGQWLENEGKQFSAFHDFGHLVATHRLFHVVAEEVVALGNAGNIDQAEHVLNGRLADLSVEISLLLEALKREYNLKA